MRIAIKVSDGTVTETICSITRTESGITIFADGRQHRARESEAVDKLIEKFAEAVADFMEV